MSTVIILLCFYPPGYFCRQLSSTWNQNGFGSYVTQRLSMCPHHLSQCLSLIFSLSTDIESVLKINSGFCASFKVCMDTSSECSLMHNCPAIKPFVSFVFTKHEGVTFLSVCSSYALCSMQLFNHLLDPWVNIKTDMRVKPLHLSRQTLCFIVFDYMQWSIA